MLTSLGDEDNTYVLLKIQIQIQIKLLLKISTKKLTNNWKISIRPKKLPKKTFPREKQ